MQKMRRRKNAKYAKNAGKAKNAIKDLEKNEYE